MNPIYTPEVGGGGPAVGHRGLGIRGVEGKTLAVHHFQGLVAMQPLVCLLHRLAESKGRENYMSAQMNR